MAKKKKDIDEVKSSSGWFFFFAIRIGRDSDAK